MSRIAPLAETVHIASLGVSLGVLVVAGVTAAVTFPTMHALDPHLPGFAGYSGPHWLIAGGHIAQRVFSITDSVQIGCLALILLTFLIAASRPDQSRALLLSRSVILSGLVGVALYRLVLFNPENTRNLMVYWDAARAGDASAAESAKNAFDSSHPVSTRLMAVTASLLLAAIVLTVRSVSTLTVPESR